MNLIYSSLIIIRVLTSLQALLDASLVLTSRQFKYSQHKGWDCSKSIQRKSSQGGRVLLSLGGQTAAWAKSMAAGGGWRIRGRLGHREVGGLSGLSTFNQRKHGRSWDYRCPSLSQLCLPASASSAAQRVPREQSYGQQSPPQTAHCLRVPSSLLTPPLRAFPCAPFPKAPDVHIAHELLEGSWSTCQALETSAQFPAKSASLPSACRRKPCALSCTGWAGMTSKTKVFIHKAETMQGRLHVQ